jgi:hypothetical protein
LQRGTQVLDGQRRAASLVQDQAQQLQSLDVLGLGLENLAIQRLGLAQTTG